MKTVLALAALLAAALAAIVFPDMKKILLLIPLALVAIFAAGCTASMAARLNQMPDGKFSKARFEETSKFTSTTIILDGVVKDNGNFKADKIHVDHTNPWLTKLVFEAENYEAQLSAAEKKKLLAPLTAAPGAK